MAASALGSSSSEDATNYLILDPSKGKKRDLFKYLVTDNMRSGMKFLDCPTQDLKGEAVVEHRWILLVSIILIRILTFIEIPLKYLGYVTEFLLNFLNQNGGFTGILYNLLHGELKIPKRETDKFVSMFGIIDGRIDLYKSVVATKAVDNTVETDIANIKSDLGNRYLMDLSVMAAKLAYENEKVIQKVVDTYWQMHFVGFYNGYNERQKQSNTQFFIFTDKPKNAKLIVVSFRGTEQFNAQDWITDLDYSWYQIPKVGKVHMGFLEALGLGNRNDTSSFEKYIDRKHSFLPSHNENEWAKTRAYYTLLKELRGLLKEHHHAKIVLTGHSLGGALAILFPCILILQEEKDLADKLLNIYTFGQPRIGDKKLAAFMESRFNYPEDRYFRVVYCNDLVPRIPFDDQVFSYRHFGVCLYYDSRYTGRFMEEQPNKNYFSLTQVIPMRLNTGFEFVRSLLLGYIHGPDYKESWFSTVFRLIGFVSPGAASHGPVDYVNSIRLGKERYAPSTSLKSFVRRL